MPTQTRSDRRREYLRVKLGKTEAQVATKSVADLEKEFFESSTASGGSDVLATKYLDNATIVNVDATSTSFANFHASATITFTAPSSGAVWVELEGQANVDTGTELRWGVNDGTSDICDISALQTATGQNILTSRVAKRITGLTPGQSYTYTWRVRRASGASLARTSYGGAAGTARMRVSAA